MLFDFSAAFLLTFKYLNLTKKQETFNEAQDVEVIKTAIHSVLSKYISTTKTYSSCPSTYGIQSRREGNEKKSAVYHFVAALWGG